MSLFKKDGLSLVELILAVLLLNVVLMAGLSIELGIRRIFLTADVEIVLLNEAGPILDWVSRDISRGIGTATDSPLSTVSLGAGNPTYRIRYDSNANGRADAADIWVAYRYIDGGGSQYELWYYPNASNAAHDILSDKVVNFSIGAVTNGVSVVTVQVRLDPSAAVSMANPEITLTTRVQYESLSLG
ncbi:MAG: hypothetical protein ABIC68_03875 [Candidatus Omnitrophota bacterium]